MRELARTLGLSLVLLAASCSGGDDGPVEVVIVGSPEEMFAGGIRLSSAAQHLRAATAEGLVRLDAVGEVVPGIADRWIVADDGRSYIFRLRDGEWPDGTELTSQSVRQQLLRLRTQLRGTSLGRDLANISEIRAMAGRVIEIRLSSPVPEFLQLLAQPELGLMVDGEGLGPMKLERPERQPTVANLAFLSPSERGQPQAGDWERWVRQVRLTALPAAEAIERFDEGLVDVVLNGRIEAFPFVETGPLSRGTIRIDPALGLFGLQVRRARGVLAAPANRAALAMAIDRAALLRPFNLGGWEQTTRVVAPDLAGDLGTIGERWSAFTMEERRNAASAAITAWRAANPGETPTVAVALPQGPGSDILFERLAADWEGIGVDATRAENTGTADLILVDRIARYASAPWFLNQFACSLERGLCSEAADARLAEALEEPDADARAALLAEAEAELSAAEVFIPFGPPVRWSLVRGDVTGFAANRWAFHPLPELAMIPR